MGVAGRLLGRCDIFQLCIVLALYGLLSPTEAAMVLTHASDTRVIYMYTLAVFGNMNNDFQDPPVWMIDDEQEAEQISNAFEAWKSSLPGV